MNQQSNLPLVSVIIPVYNTEMFIKVCIESVLNQTYQNFEIICIDDGSTDRSAEIIKRLMITAPKIRLLQIENHGQGYARNYALTVAKGEYILFLDADDYIEPVTLEVAVKKAQQDGADFVVLDWVYYNPIGKQKNYSNQEDFWHKNFLKGTECLELFKITPYFTVNKLYSRKFLDDNQIRYAEGHIYEDIPFWVNVVVHAHMVSLIQSPLYRVTIHNASTTKTNYDTDWHCVSYLKAVRSSIQLLHNKSEENQYFYYLYIYLLQKFTFYYIYRTPREYRKSFAKEFIEIFSTIHFKEDLHKSKLFSFCLKYQVYLKKRVRLFQVCCQYSGKIKLDFHAFKAKIKRSLKKKYSFCRTRLLKLLHIKKRTSLQSSYTVYTRQPLYNDIILFMGFDFRYTGNSRYLFEAMLKRKDIRRTLFFVTNDPLVPLENRIEPGSDRCNRFIARSKVIIFESWIPLNYIKRHNSIWIQLWHGTPIKKMLFDSNEKFIVEKNPIHKNSKYKDLLRWDYMITDNPNVNALFNTSFLLPNEKILALGYPRVQYLKENVNNYEYKKQLRKFYGIDYNKKVVLYLPTWRDYNYGVADNSFDLDYLVNLEKLQSLLGDAYELVYKDHAYLSKPENVKFKNFSSAETQELLLMADYVITDYSSVVFDALAIDLPVILYCNDFEKNEAARGVYPQIWEKLKPFVCQNSEQILLLIQSYDLNTANYADVKAEYSCVNDTMDELINYIIKL